MRLRRREFITLLGGAAAWPARGPGRSSRRCRRLGSSTTHRPINSRILSVAFRQGLKEAGFVDGQNVAIEYRWAEDHRDRLPALAADLVRRRVAVIVVNTPSMAAAKAATATIPIVFVSADDPIAAGLVASFNRPGGNATGVYFLIAALEAKRLELLRELITKSLADSRTRQSWIFRVPSPNRARCRRRRARSVFDLLYRESQY